jgi:hypothetical protein
VGAHDWTDDASAVCEHATAHEQPPPVELQLAMKQVGVPCGKQQLAV